jgi:hypothetical protein
VTGSASTSWSSLRTSKIDSITDDRLGVQLMRAANNVLIDRFLDEDDDFYDLARLCTRRPEVAVEEINRLGDEATGPPVLRTARRTGTPALPGEHGRTDGARIQTGRERR